MYREWNQDDRAAVKRALRAALLKLVPAGLPLGDIDALANKGVLSLVSSAEVVLTIPEGTSALSLLNKQAGRRWVTARSTNDIAVFGDPDDVLAPGSAAAYLIDTDSQDYDVIIGWVLPLE